MVREELIKIFENTVWMCENNRRLVDKIKSSMACNRVISEENADDILENLIYGNETEKEAKIIVSKKRSFEAASAYKGKHISVLNFASATNQVKWIFFIMMIVYKHAMSQYLRVIVRIPFFCQRKNGSM